jgi:hypothetical protein
MLRSARAVDTGACFDLPALEADETLLHRLGAAGGFCDGDQCGEDSRVEAGWPFFGQYIAHDLTADRSPLRSHTDLGALRNMRSPRTNLETLYGGGPAGSPCSWVRRSRSLRARSIFHATVPAPINIGEAGCGDRSAATPPMWRP